MKTEHVSFSHTIYIISIVFVFVRTETVTLYTYQRMIEPLQPTLVV